MANALGGVSGALSGASAGAALGQLVPLVEVLQDYLLGSLVDKIMMMLTKHIKMLLMHTIKSEPLPIYPIHLYYKGLSNLELLLQNFFKNLISREQVYKFS